MAGDGLISGVLSTSKWLLWVISDLLIRFIHIEAVACSLHLRRAVRRKIVRHRDAC